MTSEHSSETPTLRLRPPLRGLTEANLPVFAPPEDRSTTGVAAFLRGCTLHPARPTRVVPPLPRNLTGGHMVQIGVPSKFVFEVVVIRDAQNRCFGLYMPPPPDIRTLLPELNIIDLARSQANLRYRDGREIVLSGLTLDELSHLIILAQRSSRSEEPFDGFDIIFDD